MNDIINWIALNNTLMIRIGFSAVVLLLVVYAFRFFFMPNISVVAAESSGESKKENTDLHIEELAELQGEIDTLKAKLKELQNAEPKQAAAPVAASPAAVAAGLEAVSAEAAPPAAAVENENAAKELKEKIKTLEARLSEYEIIAEEIAEIGKLRQENQSLKDKLASAPPAPRESAAKAEPEESQISPGMSASDSEIDALLGSVDLDENTAADAANPLAAEQSESELVSGGVEEEDSGPSGKLVMGDESAPAEKELFVLHSDVEVTDEEKELINSFEEFKKV